MSAVSPSEGASALGQIVRFPSGQTGRLIQVVLGVATVEMPGDRFVKVSIETLRAVKSKASR